MATIGDCGFLKLFKQGRYSAAGNSDFNREERERFAVAAMAFCLRHDRGFRSHFVESVTGLANLSPDDFPKITPEPMKWCDLLLEGPKHVLVIEFKIGARLGGHQSPKSSVFSTDGYGKKIRERYKATNKSISYVVIGKEFKDCDRRGLKCSSLPWPRLLMPNRKSETALQKDLFDCLGHLGVSVFLNRGMTKAKMIDDAKNGMDVCAKLQTLLVDSGIEPGEFQCGPECLGIVIPKKGASNSEKHRRCLSRIKPKGNEAGWVGYEANGPKKPQLSVWFYTTGSSRTKLLGLLEPVLNRGAFDDGEAPYVIVRLAGEKSADDSAWFRGILNAVCQR